MQGFRKVRMQPSLLQVLAVLSTATCALQGIYASCFVSPSQIQSTWDDIGGLEDVKEQLVCNPTQSRCVVVCFGLSPILFQLLPLHLQLMREASVTGALHCDQRSVVCDQLTVTLVPAAGQGHQAAPGEGVAGQPPAAADGRGAAARAARHGQDHAGPGVQWQGGRTTLVQSAKRQMSDSCVLDRRCLSPHAIMMPPDMHSLHAQSLQPDDKKLLPSGMHSRYARDQMTDKRRQGWLREQFCYISWH